MLNKDEGWIEWRGGECPVPEGTLIDVRFRDDQEAISVPAMIVLPQGRYAKNWTHKGVNGDIVAYRLALDSTSVPSNPRVEDHPLYSQYMRAIEQAMFGKGERHGGAKIDFLEQPWMHYAEMHGRGFLTGQAAKKLEEAASTRNGEAFMQEVRGAIVYLGMALIWEEMNGGQQ